MFLRNFRLSGRDLNWLRLVASYIHLRYFRNQ